MDVRQLLRLTPLLDWPLAAFIGGEVAAALDFAHRRQIIHRDVSPANILVSWEGEVKLSDFGVAKVVGGPGRVMGPTQGLKGKLGYMAPEQMRAQSIDARADVYALGVVLYEMLTGKNPMRGGPIVPPPLPSTVPGELAAIVMRAVERNRERRFSSAADVLAARRLGVHAIEAPPRIVAAVRPTPSPEPSEVPSLSTPTLTFTEPVAITPTAVHKKPHPRGSLSVNAIPWANLFIDGRAAGH